MRSSSNHILPIGFGQTHIGLIRDRNEDNFLCDNRSHVYAVADGLGGLPQGDIASKMAIEELRKIIAEPRIGYALDWNNIFNKISKKVAAAADTQDGHINIGTTLTVMQVVAGNRLHIGHVGDSGIFRFTKQGGDQLTLDHTLAQEEITHNDMKVPQGMPEFYKHTLTRCIGQPTHLKVDILDIEVQQGERVLLYTDGVTKTWGLSSLYITAFNSKTPEVMVDTIIKTANERGGPDNVTAVAVFF